MHLWLFIGVLSKIEAVVIHKLVLKLMVLFLQINYWHIFLACNRQLPCWVLGCVPCSTSPHSPICLGPASPGTLCRQPSLPPPPLWTLLAEVLVARLGLGGCGYRGHWYHLTALATVKGRQPVLTAERKGEAQHIWHSAFSGPVYVSECDMHSMIKWGCLCIFMCIFQILEPVCNAL